MLHGTPARPRHGGFTLIELLVVIAIIAVLAALGIGGAYTVLTGQRASRTEDFIRTVDKVLDQHWRKVVKDAQAERNSIPDSVKQYLAGGDDEIAAVIWVKLRLVEAFPQSYAEITNPWPYTTVPTGPYKGQLYIPVNMQKYNAAYQTALATNSKGAPNLATESAACLYLALLVNRDGVKLEDDKFPVNILDTDNDGLKELVDNWGNPLTFIRFPIGVTGHVPTKANMTPTPPVVLSLTQFAELNALNPNKSGKGKLNGDPADPDGFLQTNNWPKSATGKLFETHVHVVSNTKLNGDLGLTGTAQPYFIPVLLSNGPDGVLGNDDDIFSWRLRAGVKGL